MSLVAAFRKFNIGACVSQLFITVTRIWEKLPLKEKGLVLVHRFTAHNWHLMRTVDSETRAEKGSCDESGSRESSWAPLSCCTQLSQDTSQGPRNSH